MEDLNNGRTRGDYVACGVVNAIEKGCQPQVIGNSSVNGINGPTTPLVSSVNGINALTTTLGNEDVGVDPVMELMKRCGSKVKPNPFCTDSIPCDQGLVSQSTKDDTTTFKDNQQLWTRVTSSAFLKTLNCHKIRV